MKWIKRMLWTLLALLTAGGLASCLALPRLNAFKQDGAITLSGPQQPVTVRRDEKGMAYIQAASLGDALWAQGFVTAQDRLFQMQYTRLLVHGRLGELQGDEARSSDILMRGVDLPGLARRHYELLDAHGRAYFDRYAEGVNAFMRHCPDDLPLEFKLAHLTPETWSPVDSLAILYYVGYANSANLRHEITGQNLVDHLGAEKAQEWMPLNINPDDPADQGRPPAPSGAGAQGLGRAGLDRLAELLAGGPLRLGSNNWVASPRMCAGGGAMLACDPHLDNRVLPGIWYPLGLSAPGLRAVGAIIPGMPGMAIGRTQHVALGITNNYADMLDLFLETIDPADPSHYLEGDKSLPFEVRDEVLAFKDSKAPGGMRRETIQVRSTRRGPVVSQALDGLAPGKVVSLRWSGGEQLEPSIGLDRVMEAASVQDLDQLLAKAKMLNLNWVFVDSRGGIGYRASGLVPLRGPGLGPLPQVVGDGPDPWRGFIPAAAMPHALNPAQGWLGTTNQKVVPAGYPYYYTNYSSPTHRQRRLRQLMEQPGAKTVDDFWAYQRDTKNLLAQDVAPIMAQAMLDSPDTKPMGTILAAWDFHDRAELAAPTIFALTWANLGRLVYGETVEPRDLDQLEDNLYFWEERLAAMVLSGHYPDGSNGRQLIRRAALLAQDRLMVKMGGGPESWLWGKAHVLDLVSPLARKGLLKRFLGAGRRPMDGSSATLLRGRFAPSQSLEVTDSACLRMVVDMADPDKVTAVLLGGVCGRQFSPHQKDQVDSYLDGGKQFWWYSDQAVAAHTQHSLILEPAR